MFTDKFIKIVEKAGNALAGFAMFFLAVLMFLGAADVLGRYIFNRPIKGTLELSEVFMAGVILLGWAYTQRTGGHVKVELLISHYPPRARAITDFITSFLSLVLFSFIVRQSWLIAVKNLSQGRVFPTLQLPTGYFYFFVPIGAFFLCLAIIAQMIELIPKIKGKE